MPVLIVVGSIMKPPETAESYAERIGAWITTFFRSAA
jgi:hypothetical protein